MKAYFVRSHRSLGTKWHKPASGYAAREGTVLYSRCGRRLYVDEVAVDEWTVHGHDVSRGPSASDICKRCR